MTRKSKEWAQVFLRIDSRKKDLTVPLLRKAGYPEARLEDIRKWNAIHAICQVVFRDGQGRFTYTWFGSSFFFTSQEDADLFKTLQLTV